MSSRRVAAAVAAAGLIGLAGLAALTAGGARALAHHIEVNEFDRSRPVTLTGDVVKVEWINPHPWIHLDVAGPDGGVRAWMVEAAAPNNLLRRGFSPDSIPPGAHITIEGYQARDGARRANGKTLTYADGRQFFIGYLGLLGTAEADE